MGVVDDRSKLDPSIDPATGQQRSYLVLSEEERARGFVRPSIDPATGQQRSYLVLSEEERARGFVRPVRQAYVHVGVRQPAALRDLTDDEKRMYGDEFAKFEEYPESRRPATGRFWTQKQLDQIGKGCQHTTTMGLAIAETYARNPGFYGGTFCVGCRAHLPVGEDGEFVWEGTNERVGT